MGTQDLSQSVPEQPQQVPNHGAALELAISEDGAPVMCSRDLFKGSQQVWIEHEGKRYRLSTTRNGKLILTK